MTVLWLKKRQISISLCCLGHFWWKMKGEIFFLNAWNINFVVWTDCVLGHIWHTVHTNSYEFLCDQSGTALWHISKLYYRWNWACIAKSISVYMHRICFEKKKKTDLRQHGVQSVLPFSRSWWALVHSKS